MTGKNHEKFRFQNPRVLLEHSCACAMYVLTVTAFCAVQTDTYCMSAEPKVLIVWPFTEEVC